VHDVDEQIVGRFNDGDVTAYEIDSAYASSYGYPVGLQIEEDCYSWTGGELGTTVILHYAIINRSSDTLFDCVVAQASDPDIGRADNDHVEYYAARPDLRSGLAWSDVEGDTTYGMLVTTLVEGPMSDRDGMWIDNSRRLEFSNLGQVGGFPSRTASIDGELRTDVDRYDKMRSPAIPMATDRGAADQYTLMTTTSFALRPGDTAHLAIAFSVIDTIAGRSFQSARESVRGGYIIPEVDRRVEALQQAYYRLESVVGVARPNDGHAVRVVPTPSSTNARIVVPRSDRDVRYRVINLLGQEVLTGEIASNRTEAVLDVSALPVGHYKLFVDGYAGVSVVVVR
jgi:hypothetical protein